MRAMASDFTFRDRCLREVVELHAFFQAWFRGEAADFSRVEAVLDEGFNMISTRGVLRTRDQLLASLRASHAQNRQDDFTIEIRAYQCHLVEWGLALVTYEEWQSLGEVRIGRLSSALFKADREAPCGARWLHLHETRIPEGGVPIVKGGAG